MLSRRSFGARLLNISALTALGAGLVQAAAAYKFSATHRAAAEAAVLDLTQMKILWRDQPAELRRCQTAIDHLDSFLQGIREGGYFDEVSLDRSIHDLEAVMQRNQLGLKDRKSLTQDIAQLKLFREHYQDRGYQYPF